MKMKKILAWLLVCIFAFSACSVYADGALTADEFTEKMEDLGYNVDNWYGVEAYDDDGDETYTYSDDLDKDEIEDAFDELLKSKEEYSGLSLTDVKSGNNRCITISGTVEGKYLYAMACNVEDTLITALTGDKNHVDTVKNVMKELGYYNGGSSIVIIIVVIAAVAGAVAFVFFKKKKGTPNNTMPTNNIGPMPMPGMMQMNGMQQMNTMPGMMPANGTQQMNTMPGMMPTNGMQQMNSTPIAPVSNNGQVTDQNVQ